MPVFRGRLSPKAKTAYQLTPDPQSSSSYSIYLKGMKSVYDRHCDVCIKDVSAAHLTKTSKAEEVDKIACKNE